VESLDPRQLLRDTFDVVLPLSAMTEKDRADLDSGPTLGIDWIALSFVRRAADIVEAQAIIQGRAGQDSTAAVRRAALPLPRAHRRRMSSLRLVLGPPAVGRRAIVP
jgi:hypothetical protein